MKHTKLLHIWDRLTSSYWFVPALMLVGSVGLAIGMLTLGQLMPRKLNSFRWFYTGSFEGARLLLSMVANSVITVAGVVFSITIVTLTQASSQFGPRVLRSFMRDTGNQVVLGTFVATFAYCLVVLRSIDDPSESNLPHLAITVAVLLAIASLCVLVYFIHHVSLSIQAPEVVAATWADLDIALARMFPARLGRGGDPPDGGRPESNFPESFDSQAAAIPSPKAGYIQAAEEETIMGVAEAHDLRLKMLYRPGDFVIAERALVLAWPPQAVDEGVIRSLQDAFMIGKHRTQEQDVEYAIRQTAEIAVRALSPGINDPFTAMTCIDWLGEALSRIAAGDEHSPYRYGTDGVLRVITEPSRFPGIVDAGFNMIRQYGRQSVPVTIRLLEAIASMAESLKSEEQREALRSQATIIFEQSRDAIPAGRDRDDVARRYQTAMEALSTRARLPAPDRLGRSGR